MKKLKSAWSWLVKKVDDATYYPEDRKQELEKRRGAWKALAEEDRKALAKALKQIRKDRKGREVGFDPASESAKALAGLMGKLADKGWDFNFLSQLETIEFTLLMASFFDAKADASFMAEKLKVQKVVREGQGEGYLLNPENPGYGAIVDTLNWEMLGNYGMYKRLERQMPGVIQAKGELWLWTVVELVGLSGLAVASPFVGVGLALWNLAAIPVSAMKAETGEKKEAVKSRLSKAFDGIIAGFRLSGIALAFGAQWTWDRKVEAAGGIAGAVVGAITNGLTGGVVGAIVGGVVGNLVREAWAGLKSWWAGRKAKKAAEVKSNEAELKSEAAAPAAAC